MKMLGDYYQCNEGLWEPPCPGYHYEPDHEYKLTKDAAGMTTHRLQKARVEEKLKLQEQAPAQVRQALGDMSEALTGSRTAEGEKTQPSPNGNLA